MTSDEEMIEDIRNADGVAGGIKLNQWEQEFMDNIEELDSLSPGRREKLIEIWDRI